MKPIAVVSLVALVFLPCDVSLLRAQTHGNPGPGKEWKAKCLTGFGPIEDGNKLKATVLEKELVFETRRKKARKSLRIPVAQVREISCFPMRASMYQALTRTKSPLDACADDPGPGGAICPFLALPVYAVLLLFEHIDHEVRIGWLDETGAERDIVIEVGKKHYRAFLDELQKATGIQWKDVLEEEMKAWGDELVGTAPLQDNPVPGNTDRVRPQTWNICEPGPLASRPAWCDDILLK